MQSASRSCMIINENTDVISITLQGHRATSRAGQRADRSIHSAAEFQLAERAIGRRCHRAPSGLRCHMAIRRLELPLSPYACHERTRIDHGSRDREGRWATHDAVAQQQTLGAFVRRWRAPPERATCGPQRRPVPAASPSWQQREAAMAAFFPRNSYVHTHALALFGFWCDQEHLTPHSLFYSFTRLESAAQVCQHLLVSARDIAQNTQHKITTQCQSTLEVRSK